MVKCHCNILKIIFLIKMSFYLNIVCKNIVCDVGLFFLLIPDLKYIPGTMALKPSFHSRDHYITYGQLH